MAGVFLPLPRPPGLGTGGRLLIINIGRINQEILTWRSNYRKLPPVRSRRLSNNKSSTQPCDGVKGGGCSGFSYLLDLTEQERDTDEKFEKHGIIVVCDPKSYLYLNGTTIDFKDEVMGRGFVFNNPNATSSCGCGSSFTA